MIGFEGFSSRFTYYEDFRINVQPLLFDSQNHLIFQSANLIQYIDDLHDNCKKIIKEKGNWKAIDDHCIWRRE